MRTPRARLVFPGGWWSLHHVRPASDVPCHRNGTAVSGLPSRSDARKRAPAPVGSCLILVTLRPRGRLTIAVRDAVNLALFKGEALIVSKRLMPYLSPSAWLALERAPVQSLGEVRDAHVLFREDSTRRVASTAPLASTPLDIT